MTDKVWRRGQSKRKVDTGGNKADTWPTHGRHMADKRQGGHMANKPEAPLKRTQGGHKADTRWTHGGHMPDTWRTRFGGAAKADSRRTRGRHEADTWRTQGGQALGKRPGHIAASLFF